MTNRASAASAGIATGASRSDAASLLVIEPTAAHNNLPMPEPPPLQGPPESLYEQGYSLDPASAALYARWRAMGAAGKAEHVIGLCARAGIRPASTLEIGCGDGALLCELRRRGFGGRL